MPLLFLLLLLPLWSLQAQGTPIYHYFKGAVDGQYSITMELKQVGTALEGNYFYDKYRTNIRVKGTILDEQYISLKEIDAVGNTTSSTFLGVYDKNWTQIEGQWQNRTKERRFNFDLQAIYLPKGPIGRYNFDHIRRFQELLNYFDAEPRFPFRVRAGMGENPQWKKTNSALKGVQDYQQVLPYRLAKRYIMNQVLLRPEGSYNYFDLAPTDYQPYNKHYKALCKVYQSSRYVALLCRFECDTGWERYDLTLLLLYDYAGHLLDACEVGKVLDLEGGGKMVKADWNSRFSADGRIEVRGRTERTDLAVTPVKEQVENVHFYWLVQSNGMLRRKKIVSR
jgi:hypothetical protein